MKTIKCSSMLMNGASDWMSITLAFNLCRDICIVHFAIWSENGRPDILETGPVFLEQTWNNNYNNKYTTKTDLYLQIAHWLLWKHFTLTWYHNGSKLQKKKEARKNPIENIYLLCIVHHFFFLLLHKSEEGAMQSRCRSWSHSSFFFI